MAAHRAVDKIDFTLAHAAKRFSGILYPPPPPGPRMRVLSLSLSSHTTFDSAKFETSFHATLPLFHVGRDAYKGNGGESLSRNSKRSLLLPPSPSLSLSLPSLLHRTLIRPSSVEFDKGGRGGSIDIEFHRSIYSTELVSV